MRTTKKVAIALTAIVLGLVVSPAVAFNEAETTRESVALKESLSISNTVKTVMILGHEDPQFVPGIVNLKIGDSVKFVNQDGQDGGLAHAVVSVDEKSGEPNSNFNGYLPNVGDTFTVKLSESGTYYYIDSIYPEMNGTIVVV